MEQKDREGLDRDTDALYRAVTKLTRVVQFRDRDAICCRGVSVTQCYALEALVWHGPQSVNALAEFLFLDGSTVSRVADALTRKGLVRREANPDDRRAVILSATEEGEKVCREITEDMKNREKEMFAQVEPQQRRETIALIERLAVDYEVRARQMSAGCDCGG